MGIRIITDSTTEFSQSQAREMNIDVLPLKSVFGNEVYLDGIDLSPEEFFEKLANSEELPKTSQSTPREFEELFQVAQAAGDEVIVILLAGTMSGNLESARAARDACGGDIWIIDSDTVTLGLNILVQRAVILRDEGKTAEEIVALLEVEKQSICIVAAIDTLEYLLKGGRLSKTAAITGTLLNVKPMLLVEHGVINVTGKSRGMKKAQSRIFKTIRSLGGIDFTQPFAIGYSGDPQPFAAFEEQCKKRFGSHKPNICIIGSVLGTHIGPGAVAVAFFKVKKD